MITSDPKCAEIIKPLIRGRDTARYSAHFADNWLIDVHNGFIDECGNKVNSIKIKNYLPVKSYVEGIFEHNQESED